MSSSFLVKMQPDSFDDPQNRKKNTKCKIKKKAKSIIVLILCKILHGLKAVGFCDTYYVSHSASLLKYEVSQISMCDWNVIKLYITEYYI